MAGKVFEQIEALFFDMNGTLRMRQAHEPTQRAAFTRLGAMLGKEPTAQAYWEELAERQKKYTRWAQENLVQLAEEDIWTRWMLPEEPAERIAALAPELMLAWSERKGRCVPVPGAAETLAGLKRRGYRLGLISNTMSSLDIPRSLEAFGWQGTFDVVILSAALKARKPAAAPFLAAARAVNVEPARCAYIGNRIAKDLVGCKRAGFKLGILLELPGRQHREEQDQPLQPDRVIHSLGELLEIFPGTGAGEQA